MKREITVSRVLGSRLPAPDRRRIVILTGARQTGKTTLLKQVYPGLRYINLDAVENREWVRQQSTLSWGDEVCSAVIDEAQKEPSVFEKVKYAFDDGALRFSALSGSAQVLLLGRVRETLAGRAFVFELWPLMFCEVESACRNTPPAPPLCAALAACADVDAVLDPLPAVPSPERSRTLADAQRHLLTWGGMPELLRLDDADRIEWLRSYETTYLERDLGDLARLADLAPFHTFQRLAALRSGRMLSYAELAKDAGLSPETARRYLEYLRISYQAFTLPPYHTNLTSQVVKTPKCYWADMGLLRHLSRQRTSLTGELFETYVVSELVKWFQTAGTPVRLFYYRTRSGLEADLLLETDQGLIGAEIKARTRVSASDAGPLRRLAEAASERWLGGLVITDGTRLERLEGKRLWAVGATRLLGSLE